MNQLVQILFKLLYVLSKSWPKDQKVKNLMLESLKQAALKKKRSSGKNKILPLRERRTLERTNYAAYPPPPNQGRPRE